MFCSVGSVLDSEKCFVECKVFCCVESVLDSGKCFWILGSVFGFWEVFLDSGKCFGFWCFVPMGHHNRTLVIGLLKEACIRLFHLHKLGHLCAH